MKKQTHKKAIEKRLEKKFFPIFSDNSLESYLDANLRKLKLDIEALGENYVLNVNEEECINYIRNEYVIEKPVFDLENVSVSRHEEQSGPSFRPQPYFVITYYVPFIGDYFLLDLRPENTPGNKYKAYVMINNFYYLYASWGPKKLDRSDLEQIIKDHKKHKNIDDDFEYEYKGIESREAKEALKLIGQQADQTLYLEIKFSSNHLEGIEVEARAAFDNFKSTWMQWFDTINNYNDKVKKLAHDLFLNRKNRIIRQYKILESIGLPIKKREDLPQTYFVPSESIKKKIRLKPVVTEKSYIPEPVLEQTTYYDILRTIYDVGKVIERLPSIYKNRHEEDLRDLLLLYLEPRYEGSATGETFNGSGKTDILIRHENSNVFIAECKIWKGSEQFLKDIDQLLGYLTWRDSKAAMVVFVKNQNISTVLQRIKEVTCAHANCLSFVSDETESWFNYRFHINGDPNREVKLAVLLFHLPHNHDEIVDAGS